MITIEQYIAICCAIVFLIGLITVYLDRRKEKKEVNRLRQRLDMSEASRDTYRASAEHWYNAARASRAELDRIKKAPHRNELR